jgi:enoyl-CoA hydratase/carnithine racemase
MEVADQIVANSPFGVWMTKEVMWSNLEAGSMQAAIDLENRTQTLTTFTEDMPEAMRAFLEKREPNFQNR